MKFKPWKRKDSNGPYLRFYDNSSGAYICKTGGRNGKLEIQGGTHFSREKVAEALLSEGIVLSDIGLRELNEIMINRNFDIGGSFNYRSEENVVKGKFGLDLRSNTHLNNETEIQDVSSCPFLSSTQKNGYIIVDTREPSSLFNKISELNINNIQNAQLPLGDILIGDSRNQDVLLIERKTIKDLNRSITTSHAHDQAERYYDKQREMEALGIRMQVIWIVEGENEGQRMLYNALPKSVQMDGWVNYIATIVNQQTIQSYNENHTAYLIGKLAQGFIEKSLYYKVKSGNPLVNRVHNHEPLIHSHDEENDHGVTRVNNSLASMLSYIPSIKSNVAEELSKLNKTFSEITQMSIDELMKVKGIGKKSSQEIYNDFNKS